MFGRRLRAAYRSTAHLRRKPDRLLTTILTNIPRLQRLDGRHELLAEAGGALAVTTPEHPAAGDHLRAVVRAARRNGTLPSLRDALSHLEPDDIGTAWFDLAVTVLTGDPGPLPADAMLGLVGELRELPREFGRSAVSRYVSERRTAGRPLDTGSLPEVLLRLYDARTGTADGSASRQQLVRFLELLGKEALAYEPGGRAARLLTRVTRATPDHGATAESAGPVAEPERQQRQVIIQIRVEEEGGPTDLPHTRRLYSLHGFHYEGVGEARPAFHCSRAVPGLFTGDELEHRGHEFLAAWAAREDIDWGVSRRVEFLLPDSLLGYPAELWPGGSAGVPLSRSCHVVVRSLRRYKDSSVHHAWNLRWQALDRDCPPGDALKRIGWMGPDDTGDGACEGVNPPGGTRSWPESRFPPLRLTDPADVEHWLRLNADLACLGLGTPYDHDVPLVRDAVLDALLEDGIPVMVWLREEGDPGRLLDALRDGRPPALLAELPHSVLEVRRRERRDPRSLGKQITLLWDDPTCVFSRQDSQMSGPGEGAA